MLLRDFFVVFCGPVLSVGDMGVFRHKREMEDYTSAINKNYKQKRRFYIVSEKIKCTVHIATHEQLDWLCENKWNKSEALPKNLPQRICYVAEGEDGELLADLLICEHNAVGSLGGKDWG